MTSQREPLGSCVDDHKLRELKDLERRIEGLKRWSSFLDGFVAGCVIAVFVSSVALLVLKGCK
jgi:hypothetical protein